ncbi:hypothetical protein JCM17380_24750 [Desulfosporosinus burensis]
MLIVDGKCACPMCEREECYKLHCLEITGDCNSCTCKDMPCGAFSPKKENE